MPVYTASVIINMTKVLANLEVEAHTEDEARELLVELANDERDSQCNGDWQFEVQDLVEYNIDD